MAINVWGVVAGTPGFIPISALTGAAGQILAMDATASFAEWKGVKILSNQLIADNGSAAAPGITFADLGTGFYRTGANQIGVSVNGVNKQTIAAASHTFAQNIVISGGTLTVS